jgi:hypothetical protein
MEIVQRRFKMNKATASMIAIGALAALGFAGCGRIDSGPTITRVFDLADFTRVEVSGAFKADFVDSGDYRITVTASERMFEFIRVEQAGDTLRLRTESGWRSWFAWGGKRPQATVSMPEISEMNVSGASEVSAAGFAMDNDLTIEVSGASRAEVDMEVMQAKIDVSGASRLEGTLVADAIDVKVTGASRVDLAGSGGTMVVSASGASNADLQTLQVTEASVELSGASRATVSPEDKMRIELSGASTLTYAGSPSVETLEVSGGSTLRKK